MGYSLTELAEAVVAKFPEVTHTIALGELTLQVTPQNLHAVCQALIQPPYGFSMLIDLCGVDYLHYGAAQWQTTDATCEGFSRGVTPMVTTSEPKPPCGTRFAVVYHLLSLHNNQRIRIHCSLPEKLPRVTTVTDIWQSADWYEREAFDLFGILFDGHPDLRRILTDYGFIGHPFRKDFPLIGEVEMRYDAAEQRIVYEPVSIEPRTLVPKVIR